MLRTAIHSYIYLHQTSGPYQVKQTTEEYTLKHENRT